MAKFKHLGSYLRDRRIDADISQTEIAKVLQYSHSQFVSNWERGLSAPPMKDLPRLIKLLKLNRETLVEMMVEDSRAEFEARVYLKKKQKQSV
jgi:transcriptional regulator with XRE-family HTH domain